MNIIFYSYKAINLSLYYRKDLFDMNIVTFRYTILQKSVGISHYGIFAEELK